MSAASESRETYVRRTALAILLVASFGTAVATLLHRLQADPNLIDLVIPPVMAVIYGVLFVVLWRHPQLYLRVLWTSVIAVLLGVMAPIWWFTLAAWFDPSVRLVDTLPPISALMIPIVLWMVVLLNTRIALITAMIAWLLIALPVIGYLLMHPDELGSPRGREMVITLGPVMMLVLLVIPFQRGLQQRFASLHDERATMQELAERDALTGLYNRRAGESFLRAVIGGRDSSVELALLDVDRFKSINDTHGHAVGDLVLREIAARCSARLRREDVLARWGGEEFLVLVPAADPNELGQIAEYLRAAIAAEPFEPVGRVTASFGVTRMRDGDSMASILQRADEALYAAKHEGRNRVVCR